jgi:tetratricopeptide (TPR) repeat protein
MYRLESSARAAVATLLGVIALAAVITVARAEPFRPVDPDLVLFKVGSASADRELAASEQRYRADPSSLAIALELAAAQIERGHRTSQARHFGRAEAILDAWRSRATVSAEWHVLLADIHQYRHDYVRALALLDRAIAIEPGQVRAHLMRAAIRQTRGEFEFALSDCRALLTLRESALGIVCLTQVKSSTGELGRAYELLQRQLTADQGRATDPAIRVWMMNALADMADRRGDRVAAERWLRESVGTAPDDLLARLTLSDLLLAQGRAADAAALIEDQGTTPAVLLRRAESLQARGGAAGMLIERLRRAVAEGRERGERIDGRVVARLRLLENRNCEALAAARENWRTQRESADVRLLLVTAQACGNAAAAREIAAWRASTRYEDARTDALLAAVSRPT